MSEDTLRTPESCAEKALEWAELMEEKLVAGIEKNKVDWLRAPVASLVEHFDAELLEFAQATSDEELRREAADVANLIFMIAERRILERKEGTT